MLTGRIFSVEEFATFDGPGIRMTVFLKGCPLRCTWCHNPEGQSFPMEFLRSPNGCTGCGACLDAGQRERGTRCLTEASISACPRNLVRRCGEDITSVQLIDRIMKNARLLSGGGVTFSGGRNDGVLFLFQFIIGSYLFAVQGLIALVLLPIRLVRGI